MRGLLSRIARSVKITHPIRGASTYAQSISACDQRSSPLLRRLLQHDDHVRCGRGLREYRVSMRCVGFHVLARLCRGCPHFSASARNRSCRPPSTLQANLAASRPASGRDFERSHCQAMSRQPKRSLHPPKTLATIAMSNQTSDRRLWPGEPWAGRCAARGDGRKLSASRQLMRIAIE